MPHHPPEGATVTTSAPIPAEPVVRSGAHVNALDGVRGLAVAGVVFHHFVPRTGLAGVGPLGAVLERTSQLGGYGVELFFVLSGFLITGILLDTRDSARYFRTFYARRSLRIFPLYYLALVLAFVLPPLLRGPDDSLAERRQEWFWLYGSNFLSAFTNSFLVTREFALNHFWSLAIEEQFYLVWPLAVFACRTPRHVLIFAAGVFVLSGIARAVSLPYLGPRACYMITWCRLEPLATGAILACVIRLGVDWTRVRRSLGAPALVAAAALLGMHFWKPGWVPHRDLLVALVKYPLLALVSAWLVAVATTSGPHRLLDNGVLRWLGRRSYGVYVYHGMLRLQFSALAAALAAALPPAVAIPLSLAIGFATVALISEASYRFFEAPITDLKRHFPYHPAAADPPAAPTGG